MTNSPRAGDLHSRDLQGHKNNGEGAWLAIERLEGCKAARPERHVMNTLKTEQVVLHCRQHKTGNTWPCGKT